MSKKLEHSTPQFRASTSQRSKIFNRQTSLDLCKTLKVFTRWPKTSTGRAKRPTNNNFHQRIIIALNLISLPISLKDLWLETSLELLWGKALSLLSPGLAGLSSLVKTIHLESIKWMNQKKSEKAARSLLSIKVEIQSLLENLWTKAKFKRNPLSFRPVRVL
jgi:hypothetical protein